MNAIYGNGVQIDYGNGSNTLRIA